MIEEKTIRELYTNNDPSTLVDVLIGFYQKIEALEEEVAALRDATLSYD